MIYDFSPIDAPIRQGDIFIGLPRIDMSLQEVPVIEADGEQTIRSWAEISEEGSPVTAILAVRPVAAIVATQDCDAVRAPDITLCEIRYFPEVERRCIETSSPKSWMRIITQQARLNQKWFYLPPDNRIGFDKKMGVDFMVTLRVPREELETLRYLRKGRLNSLADEHFRERISEFFRRYPYDEWYPLNDNEMKAYLHDYPDVKPFPWQTT